MSFEVKKDRKFRPLLIIFQVVGVIIIILSLVFFKQVAWKIGGAAIGVLVYLPTCIINTRYNNAPNVVIKLTDNEVVIHPSTPRELHLNYREITWVETYGIFDMLLHSIHLKTDKINPIRVDFMVDPQKVYGLIKRQIERSKQK